MKLKVLGWVLDQHYLTHYQSLGHQKKNKNIIYAFGHQHIGWTLGAVTGKIINSICNERVPNIDIEPFNPSRFN